MYKYALFGFGCLTIICLIVYFLFVFDYIKQGEITSKRYQPEYECTLFETVCENEWDHIDNRFEFVCELEPYTGSCPEYWEITVIGNGVRFKKQITKKVRIPRIQFEKTKEGDMYHF